MLGELSGDGPTAARIRPLRTMADRERTDVDADLEFDFFEDLPTTERASRGTPPPPQGRGPRPPLRPGPPGGRTPIVRLAALVGAAILLAVVIVLWVSSCGGGDTEAYEDYMGSVSSLVQDANGIGANLAEVITSRGVTLEDIDAQLAGLARQQQQVVARANDLEPPGPLLTEQQSLVESMQLLESGLLGLQRAFSEIQLASEPEVAGQALAQQAARLVAGDVVYEDLFRARSQEVMRNEGVTGVNVPELTFITGEDLVSQASLTAFVTRLIQGGGGEDGDVPAGLHGNGIESVRAEPAGIELSQTEENTIAASDQLRFLVSVRNSGEFQETQVRVRLVIQFSGGPIRKTEEIDVINPEQTKTVEFSDFANITFGEPTTLTVTVRPVPGEENTSNNVAEFPIIFTLE